MADDYYSAEHEAWAETFKRWPKREPWEKKTIDQLKAEYVAKYGYGVLIPDFNDVVHYLPDSAMSLSARRERKARNLYRVLASPTPGWAQSWASVMCWLDNIQDAMTTGLVLSMLLKKWLPKVFARAVPYLGWGLLIYDILSLIVQMGRTPFTPMKSKRALCEITRSNPFTKKAKRRRHIRLWNLKPSWGAAAEVLQTTDWLTGVGLSLGSIFGTVTDAAFVGYRQWTGHVVEYHTAPPYQKMYEITGFKSLQASAMIAAAGQTFDDETHFWSNITHAGSLVLTAPIILSDPPEEYIVDPMTVMIPAPTPTNPETIDVIHEAGLSIEDGVRWPANGEKEIELNHLSDWMAVNCQNSVTDYLFRHRKDWYGFLTASFLHEAHTLLLDSLDDGVDKEEEYEPWLHITFQMLKNGITPTDETQTEQWGNFAQWCSDFRTVNASWPTMNEVKQHLELYGVSYQTSFPTEQDPRSLEVFPPGSLDETLWEQDFDSWTW